MHSRIFSRVNCNFENSFPKNDNHAFHARFTITQPGNQKLKTSLAFYSISSSIINDVQSREMGTN